MSMMIYLLNSVIFHSYAKLPEGNEIVNSHSINYNIYIYNYMYRETQIESELAASSQPFCESPR